ncbi:hypothetical protein LTR95_007568 [Oleoguttula sp. CCFEE 5521]
MPGLSPSFAAWAKHLALITHLGASGTSIDLIVGTEILRSTVLLSTSDLPRLYPKIPSTEPLHPQRISRLRTWVSTCHESHQCGNFTYSRRNPTWLIDIVGDSKIRLVHGDELGTKSGLVKYVALSYCWGDETAVNSTDPHAWNRILGGHTTDVGARRLPFPVIDLPETLQGAISITAAMGLQYIWIDSVCVPRGTWSEEANRMHEVYGNSHFTLMSASTEKALDRMLVPRDAWQDVSRGVRLHDRWLLNQDTPLEGIRLLSPVAARAWVLQEERLSPRILYWCAQRAYWSCTESTRIEAAQPGGQMDSPLPLASPHTFMQACRNGDSVALARAWSDVVTAYAMRRLSNVNTESNRFAAFSGLATKYLSAINRPGVPSDAYLAGLWQSKLAMNLAWAVLKPARSRNSLQPGIPSWSWLSLPPGTDISMPSFRDPSLHFRLLTSCIIGEKMSDREVVTHGASISELHLAGRLRLLISDQTTVQVPWDGIEREGGENVFDFSLNPDQSMFAVGDVGRILVYEARKEEVIVKLDYHAWDGEPNYDSIVVHDGEERLLLCLETCLGAAIVLRRNDTGVERTPSGSYQRVGIITGYRQDFFDSAPVTELRLI